MVLASTLPLLVVVMFHLKQSRVCKRRLRNVVAKHLRHLNSLLLCKRNNRQLRRQGKAEGDSKGTPLLYTRNRLPGPCIVGMGLAPVLVPAPTSSSNLLCVQCHANGWFQRHFRLLVPVAVSLPSPVLASRGLPRVLLPELDQVSLLLSRSPPALHVQHVYGERHASSWLPPRLLQNLSKDRH